MRRTSGTAEEGRDSLGDMRAEYVAWAKNLIVLVGVTAVYGLAPWELLTLQRAVVVAVAFAAGLFGAAALVIAQAFRYRRAVGSGSARLRGLLVSVYVAVLFFATVFYLLERSDHAEFTGLVTRLDAFYFALTVLSTVGFGDVHADGQAARALVCAQMLFNLLVVSLAVAAARSAGPPDLPRRRGRQG